MNFLSPEPATELERIAALTDLDLDYSDLQNNFKDLTRLAASVAGTNISLVNLIDPYSLWTVSAYGANTGGSPREDSICQYTIMGETHFEVMDLSADDRFKNKPIVLGTDLRYYLGVPLRTKNGHDLGALCVLDSYRKHLDLEKIELLKIIANEIVNRLRTLKLIEGFRRKQSELKEAQKKVAHDIRSPLGGIIGLSQIISEGDNSSIEEIMEVFNMIYKSGNSILELADEILNNEDKVERKEDEGVMDYQLNQLIFKEKLEKLYQPQAKNKNIRFNVTTAPLTENIPFLKNQLLQITGNLISNSMKFTPAEGEITVSLDFLADQTPKILHIKVKDTGVGLSQEKIGFILEGEASTTDGTEGEKGYGFGLSLVKHLVDSLHGTMQIHSTPGEGAEFEIILPQ